eukprot:1158384-Pelagomonas_calceolata.AAC.1
MVAIHSSTLDSAENTYDSFDPHSNINSNSNSPASSKTSIISFMIGDLFAPHSSTNSPASSKT